LVGGVGVDGDDVSEFFGLGGDVLRLYDVVNGFDILGGKSFELWQDIFLCIWG
jgi:hypothetical protein